MAKPAIDKAKGLRKAPLQARSRLRVANILKAAGALLGEVGYDNVSTNLIAERAKEEHHASLGRSRRSRLADDRHRSRLRNRPRRVAPRTARNATALPNVAVR